MILGSEYGVVKAVNVEDAVFSQHFCLLCRHFCSGQLLHSFARYPIVHGINLVKNLCSPALKNLRQIYDRTTLTAVNNAVTINGESLNVGCGMTTSAYTKYAKRNPLA